MAGSHPLTGVQDRWEDVIADMEAMAAEYRDAGWEALELHPGDVTALPTASAVEESNRTGLDVLLPGDEFHELEELVADTEYDEYEAYRAEEGGVVFLVVAMKAPTPKLTVVFPLYYARSETEQMLERVAVRGEMRTFLRPLDDSRRVVFSQHEPDNLLPADFGAGGEGERESGDEEPAEESDGDVAVEDSDDEAAAGESDDEE